LSVCLPLYAVNEVDFLNALEKELTALENSLIRLGNLSSEQKIELKNLSTLQLTLDTQVQTLQNQLKESQAEVTILKAQSQKLETQWAELENSLNESVSELSRLKITNKVLVCGITIVAVCSLAAVIFVAVK